MSAEALARKLRGVCDFLFKGAESIYSLPEGFLKKEPALPPRNVPYSEKTKWLRKLLNDYFPKQFDKNYELKTFIRDLIFVSSERMRAAIGDESTPAYTLLCIVFDIKEFRKQPVIERINEKEVLMFAYDSCSDSCIYLLTLYHLLTDQNLIENVKELSHSFADTIMRYFEAMIQKVCCYNTLNVDGKINIIKELMIALIRVLLVDQNMITINEIIEAGHIKRFFSLFQYSNITLEMLAIFEEVIRHAALLPKFAAQVQETSFLDNLLRYAKFSDVNTTIKVINCITRFSEIRVSLDIFKEVQDTLKDRIDMLSRSKAEEAIIMDHFNKIYEFSFHDFYYINVRARKTLNAVREKNERKNMGVFQMCSRIVFTPSFIELLVRNYETFCERKSSSYLRFEILNKILDAICISHINFYVLHEEFRVLRRLIETLHLVDEETSHMVLSILVYVVTVIINDNPSELCEEFLQLNTEIQKVQDSTVLHQIYKTLHKFLDFNKAKYQNFYTGTDILGVLLTQLSGVLNDVYDIVKKHPEDNIAIMIELLKLMLKNKRENLNQFREKNLFSLILKKIPMLKKSYGQFCLFLLEEETGDSLSKTNFIAYIDSIILILHDIKSFSDFDKVNECLCLLIKLLCNNSENKQIYQIIVKRYNFISLFLKVLESFCNLEPSKVWGLEKQKVTIELLELLQKIFLFNDELGKYFRKKHFFRDLFKLLKEFNITKTTFATDLISFLLKFSVLTSKQRNCLNQINNEDMHRSRLKKMTFSASLPKDTLLEKLSSNDYNFVSFESINVRRSVSIGSNESYFYFLGDRNNSETILINFPEIFRYFIQYMLQECSFEIQRKLFEELFKLIRINSINASIVNQAGLADIISEILFDQLQDPDYPLQQLIFAILLHLAEHGPTMKQVQNLINLYEQILIKADDIEMLTESNNSLIAQLLNLIDKTAFSPPYLELNTSDPEFSPRFIWIPVVSPSSPPTPSISSSSMTSSLGPQNINRSHTQSLTQINRTNRLSLSVWYNVVKGIQDPSQVFMLCNFIYSAQMNFFTVFIREGKIYYKLEQLEEREIRHFNLEEETWNNFVLTLSWQSNSVDLNIYRNVHLVERKSEYFSNFNNSNAVTNLPDANQLQLRIGLDEYINMSSSGSLSLELKGKSSIDSIQSGLVRLGSVILFKKELSDKEINVLYCSTNCDGEVDLLKKKQLINWQLLATRNLKNYFVFKYERNKNTGTEADGGNEHASISDHYYKFSNLDFLENVFLQITPNLISKLDFTEEAQISLEKLSRTASFCSLEKDLFFRAKRIYVMANKFAHGLNRHAFIFGMYLRDQFLGEFLCDKKLGYQSFLETLITSNFLKVFIDLLSKAGKRNICRAVITIISRVLQRSDKALNWFENENYGTILSEILRRKRDTGIKYLLDKSSMIFMRNVEEQVGGQSGKKVHCILYSPMIFASIFMNSETFNMMHKNQKKVFLTIVKNDLLNEENIFLRKLNFVQYLLDVVLIESYSSNESLIFEIILNIIKPKESVSFDKETFEPIHNFLTICFKNTYKKLESSSVNLKKKRLDTSLIEDAGQTTSIFSKKVVTAMEDSFGAYKSPRKKIQSSGMNLSNSSANLCRFEQMIPSSKVELYKEKTILLLCSLLELNSSQVFEVLTPQKLLFYMQAMAHCFGSASKKSSILHGISRAFAISISAKNIPPNLFQEKSSRVKLKPFSNVITLHNCMLFAALQKINDFEDDDLNCILEKDISQEELKANQIDMLLLQVYLLKKSFKFLQACVELTLREDIESDLNSIVNPNLVDMNLSLVKMNSKNQGYYLENPKSTVLEKKLLTPQHRNKSKTGGFDKLLINPTISSQEEYFLKTPEEVNKNYWSSDDDENDDGTPGLLSDREEQLEGFSTSGMISLQRSNSTASARERILELTVGIRKGGNDYYENADPLRRKTQSPSWENTVAGYISEKLSKKLEINYINLPRFNSLNLLTEKAIMIFRKNCFFPTRNQLEELFVHFAKICNAEKAIAQGANCQTSITGAISDFLGLMLAESLTKKISQYEDAAEIHEIIKLALSKVWDATTYTSLLKRGAYSSLIKLNWESVVFNKKAHITFYSKLAQRIIASRDTEQVSWLLIFLVSIIKKLFYGLDQNKGSGIDPAEGEILFYKKCERETLAQIDSKFKGQTLFKVELESFRDEIHNLLKKVVLSLIKYLYEIKLIGEVAIEKIINSFELILASKLIIFENLNEDFLGCLIYQLLEFISSQEMNPVVEKCILLLAFLAQIFLGMFKLLLIFGETNAFDKGFDILLKIRVLNEQDPNKFNRTARDFFEETKKEEFRQRMEIINGKRLKDKWINFFYDFQRTVESEALITDVLGGSGISTKSTSDLGNSSEVLNLVATNQTDIPGFARKVRQSTQRHLSHKIEPKKDIALKRASTQYDKNLSKTAIFQSTFMETFDMGLLHFFKRRKSRDLRKGVFKKALTKYMKTRINNLYLENPMLREAISLRFKEEFNFRLAFSTGISMVRKLVTLRAIKKNRRMEHSDTIKVMVTAESPFVNKGFSMEYNELDGFEDEPSEKSKSDYSSDEESKAHLEGANNTTKVMEKKSEELLQESGYELILDEPDIDEEDVVDDKFEKPRLDSLSRKFNRTKERFEEDLGFTDIKKIYNVAYLKQGELIESVLIIGKKNLIFLMNYTLDEHGLPIDLGGFIDTDKTKWLIKNFKSSLPSFGEPEDLVKVSSIIYDKTDGKDIKMNKLPVENIAELHTSRYWLRNCALEILTHRRGYFFIPLLGEREIVYADILSVLPKKASKPALKLFKDNLIFTFSGIKLINSQNKSSSEAKSFKTMDNMSIIKDLQNFWVDGRVSNFDYLMLLNLLSGRSYYDISQYPVFPWVLSNYNGSYQEVDLMDTRNFRDFSKPMGAITEDRAITARQNYENTQGQETPPFNYGSHYSNPGIILYFLIRLMPFSEQARTLQGGKFDLTDRLFYSCHESWNLSTSRDIKELVPEFFTLPEVFLNMNKFSFGKTQLDEEVSDVILPKWSLTDPRYFVLFHKRALESPVTSSSLNKWIDLIFGYKQTGEESIAALNKFYCLTYENYGKHLDLMKMEPEKRNALLDQINLYGQVPRQLFKKAHPEKKRHERPASFFYSQSQLKTLYGQKILQISLDNKKLKITELILKGEGPKYFNQRISGLRSFSKVFSAGNKEASSSSGPLITLSGNTLFGSGSSFVNWGNPYDLLVLYSGKADKEKIMAFKKHELSSRSVCAVVSENKQWMFVGTSLGNISVYKFRSKANALKMGSGFLNTSSILKDKSLIRVAKTPDAGLSKWEPYTITFEENCKKKMEILEVDELCQMKFTNEKKLRGELLIKNDHPDLISLIITHQGKSFLGQNMTNTKEELLKRMKKSESQNEKKWSLEYFKELRSHLSEITALEVVHSYSLLISADKEGFVVVWDFETGRVNKKFQVNHFIEKNLYDQATNSFTVPQIRRTLIEREKVIALKVCEENGDFLVMSKNYASVYSVNGVLLAMINRADKKMAKFSTCLIVNNRYTLEDDYIFTGHKNGQINVWIITLSVMRISKARTHYQSKDCSSLFTDLYSGKEDTNPDLSYIFLPYDIKQIHCISLENQKTSSGAEPEDVKGKEVTRIFISNDQKKMLHSNKKGEVFMWSVYETEEANTISKKCGFCNINFGVFDKRMNCPSCKAPICGNCSKNEIIISDISLQKPVRVCDKCYSYRKDRKLVSLYDNYLF